MVRVARREHGRASTSTRRPALRRRRRACRAATLTRGTTLSTDVAAYALLVAAHGAPRARLVLDLYSNTKPDTQGVPCPLDTFPPVDGVPFGARLDALIDVARRASSTTSSPPPTATPTAAGTSRRRAPTDDGTSLDAHTAAIRGLLVAYLATGRHEVPRPRAARLRSASRAPSTIRARASTAPTPGDTSSTRRRSRRAASASSRARCATPTSSSPLMPGNEALRRSSRTASGA